MRKTILSAILIVAFSLSVAYTHLSAKTSVETKPANLASVPEPTVSPAKPSLTTPPPMQVSPSPGMMMRQQYRDGSFTGQSADAIYGTIQVKATIRDGRVMDIQFLDYPHDRQYSQAINRYAMPRLTQEAITIQKAQVDIISGATDSSLAFRASLASALHQAS